MTASIEIIVLPASAYPVVIVLGDRQASITREALRRGGWAEVRHYLRVLRQYDNPTLRQVEV